MRDRASCCACSIFVCFAIGACDASAPRMRRSPRSHERAGSACLPFNGLDGSAAGVRLSPRRGGGRARDACRALRRGLSAHSLSDGRRAVRARRVLGRGRARLSLARHRSAALGARRHGRAFSVYPKTLGHEGTGSPISITGACRIWRCSSRGTDARCCSRLEAKRLQGRRRRRVGAARRAAAYRDRHRAPLRATASAACAAQYRHGAADRGHAVRAEDHRALSIRGTKPRAAIAD